MTYAYALGRIPDRAHDRSIRDTDILIARQIEADPFGPGGPAELWGDTDNLTTTIKIGSGPTLTSITIGGGTDYTGTTIGRSGVVDTFLGDLRIEGALYGVLNGTGITIGKPGTGPGTGSALKVESFTTAQRNYLSVLPGLQVFNSTSRTLQTSNGVRWGDLPSNNYSGSTVNPTTSDDISAGYDVGSHWINTVTQEEFVCVSNAIGAAVWKGETSSTSEMVVQINGELTTIVFGMPVYNSSPGTVKKAEANNQARAVVVGLVADNTIDPTIAGNILTDGILTGSTAQWDAITGQVGGLSTGAVYYLDPLTAGHMTTSPPQGNTDIGKYVVLLGQALDTTTFELRIQQSVLL